jgi:molybdopterin adenylyltransferase
LIGGPYIETDETVIKVFRPKSALKKPWASSTKAAEQ